jgi:cell division septation protein DedD
VQITQRTTGQSATLATGAAGDYLMELAPYNTYDVTISAFGYETVRFPVTNNDGSDPNILGNMTLLPNGSTTTPPGGDNTTYTQVQGFSVQLASLAKQPDLSKFDNVKDLGRVYDVNTGGAYKVRLGVFPTRAEAAAAAAEAKADYAGAFVVADSGTSAFPGKGGTTTGGYVPPTTNPTTPTTAPGSFGRYKVQLGAFGKPENFDRNKAGLLGTVETTMRGTLTLFMIGNLNSLQEARSVQARAQSSGYSGAFVLESVNGQLVKVPN